MPAPVDVVSSSSVVQRIHDESELREEIHIVVRVEDRCVVRRDLSERVDEEDTLLGHFRLALPHVLPLEQELPVEVTHVDRVQVDHVDVQHSAQDQILHQLAADAPRPHHEHAGAQRPLAQPVQVLHL